MQQTELHRIGDSAQITPDFERRFPFPDFLRQQTRIVFVEFPIGLSLGGFRLAVFFDGKPSAFVSFDGTQEDYLFETSVRSDSGVIGIMGTPITTTRSEYINPYGSFKSPLGDPRTARNCRPFLCVKQTVIECSHNISRRIFRQAPHQLFYLVPNTDGSIFERVQSHPKRF